MAFENYPDGDQFAGHNFYATVATMVAASAGLDDGEQNHTGGRLTAGDGFGGDYTYHDSGRPAVATGDGRGGFVLDGTDTDDWFALNNQSIANVGQFGAVGDDNVASGAANSTAFNAAIAAFVALNAARPHTVDRVYVPAGSYRIDSTIVCDCTLDPDLVFEGAGIDSTVIQSTNVAPDPLFDLTNTTSNGSQRMEFGRISDMVFIGTQPGGGQPVDVVRLGAINNSTISRVRTVGGSIAGLTIGYCITTSFVDCHFGDGLKFGMRCVEQVFNNVSFRKTLFTLNTVAGFYTAHPSARGLSFSDGCAFEKNGSLGAFFQRVLGLAIHGCYFEANGETAAHTFTTRSGAAFIGGDWAVRGDVCLSGQTTFDQDDDNLTNDTTAIGCEAVSMSGNEWSPTDANQRHVILAGVDSAEIQQPGDSSDQIWVGAQGGRRLFKNVTLVGKQDHSGPHIDYDSATTAMSALAPGTSDGNRFSWVTQDLLELDLGRGLDTGNATMQPVMAVPGRLLWEYSDTVAGGGDFIAMAQPIKTWGGFSGRMCVVEAFFYVMTKENGVTGFYECGLNYLVRDDGGDIQSAAAAQVLNPDDVVTTGTAIISSTALTVASGTGIHGGMPIVIEGAGVGGIDHATVVEAVTGTAVTIRDQTATGVTDLEVRLPALNRMRQLFIPGVDIADGDTDFQVRRISGNANDKIWFDRVTVREFGANENLRPTRNPMQLQGVGSPESVVSGGIGYQYVDFAGVSGSQVWVKASGLGKTGWEKIATT